MKVTGWLAIYAAILSTIAIYLRIRDHYAEKTSLKVSVIFIPKLATPRRPPGTHPVRVEIVQKGDRPIYTEKIVARLSGDQTVEKRFKRTFTEGEPWEQYIFQDNWESVICPNLRSIYLIDSYGKKWSISRKNARRLRKTSKT